MSKSIEDGKQNRGGDELSKRIHWEPLVSAMAVIAVVAGIVIPLFIHIDNKTERKITSMHLEIKDLHNRLCLIEEGNRGK